MLIFLSCIFVLFVLIDWADSVQKSNFEYLCWPEESSSSCLTRIDVKGLLNPSSSIKTTLEKRRYDFSIGQYFG